MKISGFTFLRHAQSLGYCYQASLQSLLSLCDEVFVALGAGSDDTEEKVRAMGDSRLHIIPTQWNENMHDRGFVYAQQKMIAQYHCTGDWACYLEGDEVLHENDILSLRALLQENLTRTEVEAVAFPYLHFYGSPSLIAKSPAWYRHAPRIIRNSIRTWAPDGLFWVVMDKNKRGRYPRAVIADGPVYHYGHVRPAKQMQAKIQQVGKYWGKEQAHPGYSAIDPTILKPFDGVHPLAVKDWLAQLAEQDFQPNPHHRLSAREKRQRIQMQLENWLGVDFSKKHFTPVSRK